MESPRDSLERQPEEQQLSQDPREIIAGLLADQRFLSACAERDMGTLFRMLNRRGVSTRRIAAAVGIAQGRLYDYMNGKSRVERLAMFEQIADAFHIPGHLIGLARRHWEPQEHASPATSRPFLPASPARPEEDPDLSAVDAFRHADRSTGGGRLYSAVLTHLREYVAPRLVDLGGGQVFAAAAALTEMAGWMAHDSGRDQVAQAHFIRALTLARASGDAALASNIAASSSHLALQTGDPSAAVHWARTGLDTGGKGPHVPTLVARLHAMQARALAAAGQHGPAQESLDHARVALRDAGPGITHPWVSPFDTAALASETAETLRDMGRVREAVEYAQQAVDLRESGRARSLALSRILLSGLHVGSGDLDAALAVGEEFLAATAPTLGSIRVMQQLDALVARLEPYRSHPPVREFLMRLASERRARMLLLADILTPQGGHPA
jgi:transcriptional regulator with XRE-family HTH domain